VCTVVTPGHSILVWTWLAEVSYGYKKREFQGDSTASGEGVIRADRSLPVLFRPPRTPSPDLPGSGMPRTPRHAMSGMQRTRGSDVIIIIIIADLRASHHRGIKTCTGRENAFHVPSSNILTPSCRPSNPNPSSSSPAALASSGPRYNMSLIPNL
jgi:hypothetical protein